MGFQADEGTTRPHGENDFTFLSTVSGGGFAGAWYMRNGRHKRAEELVPPSAAKGMATYLDDPRVKFGGTANLALVFLSNLAVYLPFVLAFAWTCILALKLAADLGLEVFTRSVAPDGPFPGLVDADGTPRWGVIAIVAVPEVVLVAALASQSARTRKWCYRFIVVGTAIALAYLALRLPLGSPRPISVASYGDVFGSTLVTAVAAFSLEKLLTSDMFGRLLAQAKSLKVARIVSAVAWIALAALLFALARVLALLLRLDLLQSLDFGGVSIPTEAFAFLGIFLLGFIVPERWCSNARYWEDRIREGFGLGETAAPTADAPYDGAPIHIVNTARRRPENGRYGRWEERYAESRPWPTSDDREIARERTSLLGLLSGQALPVLGALLTRKDTVVASATAGADVDAEAWRRDTDAMSYATAIATSGAVIGPAMGSFTIRPLSILLNFFNVRLGRWVRPDFTLLPYASVSGVFLNHLTGWPYDKRGWEHLTDGGHFDNLGLYEAVRRGCTHIVIVDAGRDPNYEFADLSKAARLVRRDFDAEISISGLEWVTKTGKQEPTDEDPRRQTVYAGFVRYNRPKAGEYIPHTDEASRRSPQPALAKLAYVKPTLTGREPVDVAGYASAHSKFPHESTVDQWFSESQFESYRRLGEYIVEDAIRGYRARKAVFRPEGLEYDAIRLVEMLKSAGVTATMPELSPTHGGVILLRTLDVDDVEDCECLFVNSTLGSDLVLPKGHIEHGESPFECALREFEEEAGFALRSAAGEGEPVHLEKHVLGVLVDKYPRGDQEVRVHYFVLVESEAQIRSDAGTSRVVPAVRLGNPRVQVEGRTARWISVRHYLRRASGSSAGGAGGDAQAPYGFTQGVCQPLLKLVSLLQSARNEGMPWGQELVESDGGAE